MLSCTRNGRRPGARARFPHTYCRVQHRDDPAGGWVADSWSCPCGAGGLDHDNVGDAEMAARKHWRDEMKAALGS
jgi:hypothetical protein